MSPMFIRRIVPNIPTSQPEQSRAFYGDFLGMRLAMDMGWIVTYVSPVNPTAQISLVRGDISKFSGAGISIEVDDVDAMCAELAARGVKLLNGPMDRPWGIRTASFQDPAGHIWEIGK